MTTATAYSIEGFKDAFPQLFRCIETMGKTDKKLTFEPQSLVVVPMVNPMFKTPNAEIRSWARKNLHGKYARRILYRDASVSPKMITSSDQKTNQVLNAALFFFSKAEDAITFSLHASS